MRRRLSRNKIIIGLSILVALVLLLVLIPARKQKKERRDTVEEIYTCPMHPQIIRNEPGACPICGMDLVKKTTEGQNLDTLNLSAVVKEPEHVVISEIKAIRPKYFAPESKIEATGYIAYDARRFNSIASRYDGRIEKLYVKYNFQPVSKGQKLFEIYSPELLTAQKDYIFILNKDAGNTDLINKSKVKLRLLGMTESQIDELARTRKADYAVAVFSPYNGYITESSTLEGNNAQANMSAGMQSSVETAFPDGQRDVKLREGTYINKGQTLFNIINTDEVWAVVKIFADNAAALKLKQQVDLFIGGDTANSISGRIDFIEPVFEAGSRAANARIYLKNPHQRLKIGDLVTARIYLGQESSLYIPEKAVLDLGTRRVVFLKRREDVFAAHEVTTGITANGWIEITGGLTEADVIAADAQFMVDSESFIETEIE